MAEEMKNLPVEESAETEVKADKKTDKKTKAPKENFFKVAWKKIKKFCSDIVGEMKKVVWTPKAELKKNTILVVVTVLAIAAVIAAIDTAFSAAINGIAGLFPLN